MSTGIVAVHTVNGPWGISINWDNCPVISSEPIAKFPIDYSNKNTFDVTESVRDMYNGALANNGFLLYFEDTSSTTDHFIYYYGPLADQKSQRPCLVVRYDNNVSVVKKSELQYSAMTGPLTVDVFTVAGRKIRSSVIGSSDNIKALTKDLTGAYILNIKDRNGVRVKKCIPLDNGKLLAQ